MSRGRFLSAILALAFVSHPAAAQDLERAPVEVGEEMTREEALAELRLSGRPSRDDIRRAFRRRLREVHPDQRPGPDAEARLGRAVAAYERLRPEKKGRFLTLELVDREEVEETFRRLFPGEDFERHVERLVRKGASARQAFVTSVSIDPDATTLDRAMSINVTYQRQHDQKWGVVQLASDGSWVMSGGLGRDVRQALRDERGGRRSSRSLTDYRARLRAALAGSALEPLADRILLDAHDAERMVGILRDHLKATPGDRAAVRRLITSLLDAGSFDRRPDADDLREVYRGIATIDESERARALGVAPTRLAIESGKRQIAVARDGTAVARMDEAAGELPEGIVALSGGRFAFAEATRSRAALRRAVLEAFAREPGGIELVRAAVPDRQALMEVGQLRQWYPPEVIGHLYPLWRSLLLEGSEAERAWAARGFDPGPFFVARDRDVVRWTARRAVADHARWGSTYWFEHPWRELSRQADDLAERDPAALDALLAAVTEVVLETGDVGGRRSLARWVERHVARSSGPFERLAEVVSRSHGVDRALVTRVSLRVAGVDPDAASRPRRPGRWSRQAWRAPGRLIRGARVPRTR